MSSYKIFKGIAYFGKYESAKETLDKVRSEHPEARIVDYERGWTVQYRKSGPYFPEKVA